MNSLRPERPLMRMKFSIGHARKASRLLLTCLALVGGCGRDSDISGAGRLTWTLTDLETRLRDNGLEPTRGATITQPFMGPPGVVYRIKGGELQAYIYADAVAVGRDTDKLDTTRVSPPNMMISWVMPPSLITENNLAVILLTRDGSLRDRVKRAITAKPTKHGYGQP